MAAYDNEFLQKARRILHWESDSIVTGIAQAVIGYGLAYTVGLLCKWIGFYICVVVIVVEIMRRKQLLGLNYDKVYNLLVKPTNASLEVINTLAEEPVHRNFIAGVLLGFCASIR